MARSNEMNEMIYDWDDSNNYFNLLDNEKLNEANAALKTLAAQVYQASKKGDEKECDKLARQFYSMQDTYEGTGMGDTEPRIIVSDIVLEAGKGQFDSTELLERVAGWFRWWPEWDK